MTEIHEKERRLAQFREECRLRGIPFTVQRRVVLEVLLERDDHPSAEQLYREVQERLPGVSKTTVYRVLETLVRLGVARRASHPGAAARFDPIVQRHHHLVCRGCDRVIDIRDPELDRVPVPRRLPAGFEVDDFSIHFEGLCADCQKDKIKAKGGSSG